MEDEAIICLYWQRDEGAIRETRESTETTLERSPGRSWQTGRTVRKASATPIFGRGIRYRPKSRGCCPPTWEGSPAGYPSISTGRKPG